LALLNDPSGSLHYLFDIKCPPWLNAMLSRSIVRFGCTVDPGASVAVFGTSCDSSTSIIGSDHAQVQRRNIHFVLYNDQSILGKANLTM
jgi:hypothetical protein